MRHDPPPSLWPDLRARSLVGELMDDPSLPTEELEHALRGLARLNRVSASWRAFVPALRNAFRYHPSPLRVLDVASGGGDNVAALMAWARREGIAARFDACDFNPHMVRRTLEAMRRVDPSVSHERSFICDVVQNNIPGEYDVVICSLFLHHLSREDVIGVLSRMGRATVHALVVSDLCRSRWNWIQVGLASRVLSSSRVVRVDALRSIEAAWTPQELLALAQEAGLHAPRVRAAHPARMVLQSRGAM